MKAHFDAPPMDAANHFALSPLPQQPTEFSVVPMVHFTAPETVVFGPLPKSATGEIQKLILRATARAIGTPP